jgi:Flp pilus assembly protein TadG
VKWSVTCLLAPCRAWRRHRGQAERGTSAVELALVLPVFLMLVFGTVDLGQAVMLYSMCSQGAREGARTGQVLLTATPNTAPAMSTAQSDAMVAAARDKAGPLGTLLTVTPTTGIDANGPYVKVRVSSTYQPVVGQFLRANTFTTVATSSLYLP